MTPFKMIRLNFNFLKNNKKKYFIEFTFYNEFVFNLTSLAANPGAF